jgi:hypothetical protein
MSASKDTLQSKKWNVHSVYVPKRDSPKRIEEAYHVLLGNEVTIGNELDLERSTTHARGNLCSGIDGSPRKGTDH